LFSAIGTSGTYKAYAGNNSNCVNALPANSVCVVDGPVRKRPPSALTMDRQQCRHSGQQRLAAAAMDTIPTTTARCRPAPARRIRSCA
jgi:type IV pilus assembly protein PilY1